MSRHQPQYFSHDATSSDRPSTAQELRLRSAVAPERRVTQPIAAPTPGRNRTNAAWMRAQLGALEAEIARREAYEQTPMTTREMRRALEAIREGHDWR
jgi:hypothetical protein